MSNRKREERGSKRAGVSVGGQFARGEQTEAAGDGLVYHVATEPLDRERPWLPGLRQRPVPADQVVTEWRCSTCHETSTCLSSDLSHAGSPLCSNESCANFDTELDFIGATGPGGTRAQAESVRLGWKCPGCGAESTMDPWEHRDGGSPVCFDDGCTNFDDDYRLETVDFTIDLDHENGPERELAKRQHGEDLDRGAHLIADNLGLHHALTDDELGAVSRYVESFEARGVSEESAAAASKLSEALEDANFHAESIALDAAVTRARLREDSERPLSQSEVWNLGFMHRHRPLDDLTLERVTSPEFGGRFHAGLGESRRRRAPFGNVEV